MLTHYALRAPPATSLKNKGEDLHQGSDSSDLAMAGTAVVCAIALLCAVKVQGFKKIDGAPGKT